MTAPRRMLAVLLAATVAASALTACGESLSSNDVAEVGSEHVTKQQLEHWLRVVVAQDTHVPAPEAPIPVAPEFTACLANQNVVQAEERAKAEKNGETPQPVPTLAEGKAECAEKLVAFREAALNLLLTDIWFRLEAQHIGASVSEKELQQEFTALKEEGFGTPPDENAFHAYLEREGYKVEDVELKTRDEMLKKSITRKLLKKAEDDPVTHAEIAAFYDKNKKLAYHPESKLVDILLTKTEAEAKTAKAEIESGQSFEAVAKGVSIYHAAGSINHPAGKGYQLEAVRKHLPATLEEEVWSLKQNVLTGPLQTEQGYYVLELEKTTPASNESLKRAEKAIKYAIISHRLEKIGKHFPEEFEARWRKRTTCRTGYIIPQCKEFNAGA